MKKIIIASLLSSVVLNAQALHGINTNGGAMTLPAGKLKLGVKHIYLQKDHMYKGSKEIKNDRDLKANVHMTMMVLRYGVSKNFDLKVALPYKQIDSSANFGKNKVAIDNKGIGDMLLMARYVVLPLSTYGYQVAVGAGIKLPTGSTKHTFKKSPPFALGVRTPLPSQLGTGEYEYKAELGITKIINKNMRVDFNTIYTYRPKAKYNYDFGNELKYDLSFTSSITNKLSVGIEYNGKYNTNIDMGEDTNAMLRANLPVKAFSGTVGYITPEIEFYPLGNQKVHFGMGVSFLAHYNVPDNQTLEKQRYVFRFGYLF